MKYILGIDEVGRGCLAGPVHMASVLLDDSYPRYCNHLQKDDYSNLSDFKFIRDSKKLSLVKRKIVLDLTIKQQLYNQTVHASSSLIDKYGIGVCLSHIILILLSLCEKSKDCEIIIDGQITLVRDPNKDLLYEILKENGIKSIQIVDINILNILRENKADDNYLSVAMASSIAKVIRDDLMNELHRSYPEFGWDQNKGYGTAKNREAIKKHLDNPQLRQSYLGNIKGDLNIS
jgi:ribonuclease HII